MKISNYKLIIIMIVLIGAIMSALPAQAAEPLVQCGGQTTRPCEVCDIVSMFQRIVNYATLTLTPLIAFFFIVFSGALMVLGGASPEMVSKGRKMLTNTVIALVIIYGSFMVVTFLLNVLAGDTPIDKQILSKSWFKIVCEPGRSGIPIGTTPLPGGGTTKPPTTGGGGGGGTTGTWNPPPFIPGVSLMDADARAYLIKNSKDREGIPMINPEGLTACTDRNFLSTKCGSFEGVKIATLDAIVKIQQECKCAITVNDTTGPRHDEDGSHPNGTGFDINDTADFIKWYNGLPEDPRYPGNPNRRRTLSGINLYNEGTHVHGSIGIMIN